MKPLFTPYTLNNGIEIKNRLVVAPMTHWASHDDGTLSDEERLFLSNRAEDFGMFITAATLVQDGGKAFKGQPCAIDDSHLPSLKEVAQILQNQGAKAILQLHHGGKLVLSELNQADKVAPSDDETTGARSLRTDEIEKLVQSFANAADLAIQAGFNGVEIHGANGYLIQQFVSAQSNQRTDKYGGSIQNRLRFSLDVVRAIDAVKTKHKRPDFIVGYRFSPEEAGDKGLTMNDTFALIDALVNEPLQYLHVSLWNFDKKARRGADTSKTRIELIHQRINGRLPLIGVGNLLSCEQISKAYATGWAEFIALGKAVLMNPDIAILLKNGQDTDIITELDPNQTDRYGIPSFLWQRCITGEAAFLPPVKGKMRLSMDS